MSITEPGIYSMTDEEYHADPIEGGSLSSTGAKWLTTDPPAKLREILDNGRPDTVAFDEGKAAHALVLGTGPELVEIPGSWVRKANKETVAEVRERGGVPLHSDQWERVHAMADAVKRNDLALALLTSGTPEQSAFWQDERTGVWCRARFDVLPDVVAGRMIVPDYKTAASARPDKFARSAADYDYNQQADFYLRAVRALGLASEAAFVFVVQEKSPPYLVAVRQIEHDAMQIAARLNDAAIDTFAQCQASGEWPGYPAEVEPIEFPSYYYIRNQETP